ncbi:MAG: VUT family protein [Pseudomonadota bacterium]
MQTRLKNAADNTPTERMTLRWVYVYVALIPLVNWSFAHVPTVAMPDGGAWSPMAIVTGLVLVFRDFAQREVHHYIILPLMIGIGISYFMAPPAIALASGMAFAASELIDYVIFTVSKRPFSSRVMLSTMLSAPVDSALFLIIADIAVPGVFSTLTLITSVASKLFGAYVVYLLIKRREREA